MEGPLICCLGEGRQLSRWARENWNAFIARTNGRFWPKAEGAGFNGSLWPLAAFCEGLLWVDSCRSKPTWALVTSDANGWSRQMKTASQHL